MKGISSGSPSFILRTSPSFTSPPPSTPPLCDDRIRLGQENTLHTDPAWGQRILHFVANSPLGDLRRRTALHGKNTLILLCWVYGVGKASLCMFFLKVVFSYEYSNLYSLLRIAADFKESLPNCYTTVSCEDVGGYHPVKIARPYACVLNNLVKCPFTVIAQCYFFI